MRKITELAVKKFVNDENFKRGNMEVRYQHDCSLIPTTRMYLHGNCIAIKRYGKISITNAGWFSTTTKERLNGILSNIFTFNRIYNYLLWKKYWRIIFSNFFLFNGYYIIRNFFFYFLRWSHKQ